MVRPTRAGNLIAEGSVILWAESPRTRRARRILSVMLVPIQLTVPNRMRGQTMSIAYCGVNLLGTGLGPFLVGFLNERLYEGGATLGLCMAAVSLSSATIATILIIVSGARQA
jgi:hypothetical protein